jgi:hypothetical protein
MLPETGKAVDGVPAAERKGSDFLNDHSHAVASVFGAVAIGIFIASFAVGLKSGLPADAFDWTFGLRVLRAGVAVAIVWALGVILIRGCSGVWPSKVSTSGVEFEKLEMATNELEKGAQIALEVTRGLAALREEE